MNQFVVAGFVPLLVLGVDRGYALVRRGLNKRTAPNAATAIRVPTEQPPEAAGDPQGSARSERVSSRARTPELSRIGKLALIALCLTSVSFPLFALVVSFGDNDLPPYWPDTPVETIVGAIWYAALTTSGVLWLYVLGALLWAFDPSWFKRRA